ncbi:MAG TPA: hypothetical protein VGS06_26345, partial [Streptosporangiaceae bacterium]|nr:hypothetical protein [Streptosporangiaceae bacterium]
MKVAGKQALRLRRTRQTAERSGNRGVLVLTARIVDMEHDEVGTAATIDIPQGNARAVILSAEPAWNQPTIVPH